MSRWNSSWGLICYDVGLIAPHVCLIDDDVVWFFHLNFWGNVCFVWGCTRKIEKAKASLQDLKEIFLPQLPQLKCKNPIDFDLKDMSFTGFK